jgi:hypothetical protein
MQKWLLCLLTLPLLAQTPQELQRRFTQGKELLQRGKFVQAREVMAPLIVPGADNVYAEYAYYYCSLASFHAKNLDEAQLFARQLIEKYPQWNKLEDAWYLLANIEFERKDEIAALAALRNVRQDTLLGEAIALRRFYLKDKSLGQLRELHQKDSEDPVLAGLLYQQLSLIEKPSREEQQLLKSLSKQFDFKNNPPDNTAVSPPSPMGIPTVQKVLQKDRYTFSVLFPFQVENTDPNRNVRSNQILLDFYQGMQVARQELETKQIDIDLQAIEMGKDANQMLELINTPGIENTDLFVGPLYPASNQVAAAYADQQETVLINPITTNARIIDNHPASLLFKPSLEMRARKAAEFALSSLEDKPVMILYSLAEEDSAYAYAYFKALEEGGRKQISLYKIDPARARELSNMLANKNEKNTSHLFIATSQAKVVSVLMNALEAISSKFPVLTPSDWFRFDGLNFERLEVRHFHFIYPEYLDTSSEALQNFKKAYLRKTNLIPSFYAYQGYELMYFFANQLHTHGIHFLSKLRKAGPQKGRLFPGFDYSKGNDNGFVPIYKLENADFKQVN